MTQIELRVFGAQLFLSFYTEFVAGRSDEFRRAEGGLELKGTRWR